MSTILAPSGTVATPLPPRVPVWDPPQQGDWTYADYLRLPEVPGFRYEVIHGKLRVSPSPIPRHQVLVTRLAAWLHHHVETGERGLVAVAPLDVVMGEAATPCQPDLLFVANDHLSIVQKTRIEGAPDLLVEVLSPRTEAVDRHEKLAMYFEAGVREYWIVDPDKHFIELYVKRQGAFAMKARLYPGDTFTSEVLPQLTLPLDQLFRD